VAAVTAKRARVSSSAEEPQLSPNTRWRQSTLFDLPRGAVTVVTAAAVAQPSEEAAAAMDVSHDG
jgi:hypothetical protein